MKKIVLFLLLTANFIACKQNTNSIDKKTEKEGAAEKVVSKVKEVAEDAKDAVEGAIEGVKNMVKKDDK